jgi:hypothetical protein
MNILEIVRSTHDYVSPKTVIHSDQASAAY